MDWEVLWHVCIFPQKMYKQGQLFTQVKQYFFQDGYSRGQVDRVAV